jgi:signal transduction histidine kinase
MRREPVPSSRSLPWLACAAIALALMAWQRWVDPGLEAALASTFGAAAPVLAMLLPALVAGSLGYAWLRRHAARSARLDDELARHRGELEAMARRLLRVQEDERRSLSRELHDDIGQQITAIKLGALALQGDPDPLRAETVDEIIAIADQTTAKLRDLSMLLRPPQLDALGLEAALRWQAERLFRSGHPRLELDLSPLPRRPAPDVELACFRIAQEALTNVLRHAGARNVAVRLRADGERALALEVVDDGRGFDRDAASGGLGLVTMRERARQLGGTLAIDSDERGTRVAARLPMSAAGE